MKLRYAGILVGALATLAMPASAQKAKDTIRYPVSGMEAALDSYLFPGTFHYIWAPSVYDNLLAFNSSKGQFAGQLAKSWSQPNPTTYEYELRDDIKWHDGQPFTADDVVYTLNWVIDPKVTGMRNKGDWSWIDKVEKLGSHKVRIVAKKPVPEGMMRMSGATYIFPKHIHEPLANKQEFGARPIGTGPFKITQFDKNSGIVAERNTAYVPTAEKPRSGVAKVIGTPMNDKGSVVATMLVGQADIASELAPDQIAGLLKTGNFEISYGPQGLSHSFIGFPTSGWRSAKALSDVRVRKAIAMAIDRKQLLEVMYGDDGKKMQPMESICFKEQLGCGYTTTMPAYDPAASKKLLAEAGYPDGFDLTISTYAFNISEATAVSGMLRAVGIRASVQQHQIPLRDQLIRDGKVEMGYHGWSGGAIFDVSTSLTRHFLRGEYEDATLTELADKTFGIMDDAERRKATTKAVDYATENAYIFATVPVRIPTTHSKEVKILAGNELRTVYMPAIYEFGWK